jgi:peroxiredoxin
LAIPVALLVLRKMNGPRPPVPVELKPGKPLPDFAAVDESGKPVRSRDLQGAPAVIIFVRGNWCPFCARQVEDLTRHYKEIVALGARLIFITPKPLQTTRRVAEFFKVDFEFWLDESLTLTRRFGLVMSGKVPVDSRGEYGEDTVWPTVVVVDATGIIRYTHLSRYIFDRPQPERLLKTLRKLSRSA